MTPREAGEVLAMAARADRRTVGAEDIKLWCTALTAAGITRDEALAAVIEHTSKRPEAYLTHGHVIDLVRRRRRTRLESSWRIEHQALAAVDPDDPAAVATTIRQARAGMVTGRCGPGVPALPGGRYETEGIETQRDRNARGAALARTHLQRTETESEPAVVEPKPLTRSEQVRARALTRARIEPRDRRDDPVPIGRIRFPRNPR